MTYPIEGKQIVMHLSERRNTRWEEGLPYPAFERQTCSAEDRAVYSSDEIPVRLMSEKIETAQDEASAVYHMTRWLSHHPTLRTFTISEGLCQALMDTEIRKTDRALVRLPAYKMYVDVSQANIFYLDVARDFEPVVYEGVFIVAEPGDEARMVVAILSRTIRNTPMLSWCALHGEEAARILSGDLDEDEKDSTLIVMLRLVFNSILYVNSVNAEVREEWLSKNTNRKFKKAKGKHRRKIKKVLLQGGRVCRVGQSISVPTVPQYVSEMTDSEEQRKLTMRFMVRGHWRWQWYGPRNGEREQKPRWIAPYWKGPELADVIARKTSDYIADRKVQ